jgi:4-hydroxy-tetrahydrodipicolinate reductase
MPSTNIRVCLAGATGWAGSELARSIAGQSDLVLVTAVSRSQAGRSVGDVLGTPTLAARIYRTAAEAVGHGCDVFVEYTSPAVARANILAALTGGAHVVVGTSGLTEADYAEIAEAAARHGRAVLACGNFALTAVLLQRFAAMAAKVAPHWEILDYAGDTKRDASSGTVRELASRLAGLAAPPAVPIEETVGLREARGGTLADSRVHSVRLPGFVIGAEIVFGLPDQRLSIRHDAGNSARPYVDGALLAIRKVGMLKGLTRGLDAVLDL